MPIVPLPIPDAAGFYQRYVRVLRFALRQRALTLGGLALLTLISVIGFGQVKTGDFPGVEHANFLLELLLAPGLRYSRYLA